MQRLTYEHIEFHSLREGTANTWKEHNLTKQTWPGTCHTVVSWIRRGEKVPLRATFLFLHVLCACGFFFLRLTVTFKQGHKESLPSVLWERLDTDTTELSSLTDVKSCQNSDMRSGGLYSIWIWPLVDFINTKGSGCTQFPTVLKEKKMSPVQLGS